MTADRNARIQERAYHLWLEEGRPYGRHDEHWHRAERELIEAERRLREAFPVTASPDATEASGAPEVSGGKATPSRSRSRREPAVDNSRAKPPTSRSRPATAGSAESRGSRRSAAKPAE
jgi:hypothetical protein